MSFVDLDIRHIKNLSNTLILASFIGLLISVTFIFKEAYEINKSSLESALFPPTKNWTFRNWEVDNEGRWSAEVYYFKARTVCRYVSTQIVTATYKNPDDTLGETLVTFLGDISAGNTRPGGWQRLDNRLRFDTQKMQQGALVRAEFLHICHEGLPTVSGFRDIVVGEQMPWPAISGWAN